MAVRSRTLCLAVAAFALLATSMANAQSTQQRKQKIKEIEAQATALAIARKSRSDELLRKEGVPVSQSLPPIQDETQVKRRTAEEIAWRALALLAVSIKGNGLDEAKIQKLVEKYNLGSRFTPDEQKFIRDPNPSEHDRSQYSWRYEAAWVLLWSMGYVDELGKPVSECDVDAAITMMLNRTSAQFIADAKLRPLDDIVEQADRIYRYHWAVVDARLNKGKAGGLNPDVTVERHHALNWLIGYMNAEWDDVSTDT